ncbi:MAG: GLUG motif-containing protein [Candidatus Stygibacter australis]|nr:GLUG motif-containing protein [Candidatus Stygibacter australis]
MKGHIILLITLAIFSLLFADGTPAEGAGTENDPYLIETLDNLLWLSTTEAVWDSTSYFLQTADIDASDTQTWNNGEGFSPIGNYTSRFQGSYNGAYYNIDGLYIIRPIDNYIGLFGFTSRSTIEALSVINVNVYGHFQVGGLVGANNNQSLITECNTSGNVIGYWCVGGMVGINSNNSPLNICYATCIVSGLTDNVGGLVGTNYRSTLSTCYATGNVSGYTLVGGLIGENHYQSTLSKCYATGNVTGHSYIGGLAGSVYSCTLNASYATGNVIGEANVGGLAGRNYVATISSCYAIGSVSGNDHHGGLVGLNYFAQINNCVWNSGTTGQTIGIGYDYEGVITNLIGATTAEMQIVSTYTDIDWDFVGESINGTEEIWDIDDEINDGYPYIYDIEFPVSNDENVIHPGGQELEIENYPNPFNPVTNIFYELGEDAENVTLAVYNIRGQRVWQKQLKETGRGSHTVIWSGKGLASGIYFYMIRADENARTGKMIMLK